MTPTRKFLSRPMNSAATPTTPYLAERQQITSIGLQDVVTITSHLLATVGFSADHLDGLRAASSNTPTMEPSCSRMSQQYQISSRLFRMHPARLGLQPAGFGLLLLQR